MIVQDGQMRPDHTYWPATTKAMGRSASGRSPDFCRCHKTGWSKHRPCDVTLQRTPFEETVYLMLTSSSFSPGVSGRGSDV